MLQVTPARLKLKSTQGLEKVDSVQLCRFLLGSLKDLNKWVKQDSSLGSGEEGGRKVHISMKRIKNLEIRMSR